MPNRVLSCSCLVVMTLLPGAVFSQAADYPSRQVTLIVPFGPGASTDIEARLYTQKLTELFTKSDVRSITVLKMEVPCCGGIAVAAQQALAASGRQIPLKVVTIGIQGDIKG